tara:strand:+ start:17047 stop:17211 length:165 start_codon:yes stop_codon:yes gene_type:complete
MLTLKRETMCGRYSEKQDLKKVEDQLKLRLSEKAKNWKPSFNCSFPIGSGGHFR